jgi:hypothetical protein
LIGYEWARQVQLVLMSLNGMCFFTASDADYREMRVTRDIEGTKTESDSDEDETKDDSEVMPPTPAIHGRSVSSGGTITITTDDNVPRLSLTLPGTGGDSPIHRSETAPLPHNYQSNDPGNGILSPNPSFDGRTRQRAADIRRQVSIIREANMLVEFLKSTSCWVPVPGHTIPDPPGFAKMNGFKRQHSEEPSNNPLALTSSS